MHKLNEEARQKRAEAKIKAEQKKAEKRMQTAFSLLDQQKDEVRKAIRSLFRDLEKPKKTASRVVDIEIGSSGRYEFQGFLSENLLEVHWTSHGKKGSVRSIIGKFSFDPVGVSRALVSITERITSVLTKNHRLDLIEKINVIWNRQAIHEKIQKHQKMNARLG